MNRILNSNSIIRFDIISLEVILKKKQYTQQKQRVKEYLLFVNCNILKNKIVLKNKITNNIAID